MGYGAEIMAEMEADYYAHIANEEYNAKHGRWTMKDGTVINIKDMTNPHIINCIMLLKRKDDEVSHIWLNRFEEELKFRRYIKAIVKGELDE